MEVLNKGEIKSLRIHRWLDRMSIYSYEVVYRPGKYIHQVDCLSRNSRQNILASEQGVNIIKDSGNRNIELNIKQNHSDLMHRGIQSMEYKLNKRNILIIRVRKIIKKVITECAICNMYNSKIAKEFIFVTA